MKVWVSAHKIKAAVLIAVALSGGYYVYGKMNPAIVTPRYLVALARKETVISSVTGTGQISAENQFDIKSKVSGDVIYLPVSEGQSVKTGALILQIDSKDAAKAVRDAEASLLSAKISLEKLKQPADALSLLQAENALTQAEQNKQITITNAQAEKEKIIIAAQADAESTLTRAKAQAEAKRCMSCGQCFECDNCVVYCPQTAVFKVPKSKSTTGRYVDTDYSKCIGCHICADVCPTGYIQMGLGE